MAKKRKPKLPKIHIPEGLPFDSGPETKEFNQARIREREQEVIRTGLPKAMIMSADSLTPTQLASAKPVGKGIMQLNIVPGISGTPDRQRHAPCSVSVGSNKTYAAGWDSIFGCN